MHKLAPAGHCGTPQFFWHAFPMFDFCQLLHAIATPGA